MRTYLFRLAFVFMLIFGVISVFSPLYAEKENNQENDRYLLVKGLYQDGVYQPALKELKAFLGDYPKSKHAPDVLYFIADIYLKQKEDSEALRYYKEIFIHYPDYPKRETILTQYFKKRYQSKDYRESLDSLEIIIKDYPQSGFVKKAYRYKREILLKLKEYQQLIQYYQNLLEETPKGMSKGEIYFNIGEAYIWSGDLEKAKENLSLIIQEHPQDPFSAKGMFALGQLHYRLNEYEKALDIFDEFIKKYPQGKDITEVKYYIIRCLYRLKKYEEGAKQAEKIKNSSKNNAKRLFLSARQEVLSGEYQKGIEIYENVIKKYPKDVLAKEAYLEKAAALGHLERYSKGIKILENFINRYHEDRMRAKAELMIGDFFYQKGSLDKSSEAYGALLNTPYYSEFSDRALLKIAEIQRESGDYQKALETYDRLEKQYPYSDTKERFYLGKGEISFALRDYSSALGFFNRIKKEIPNGEFIEQTLFKIGLCYFKQRDYERAVESFQYLLKTIPESRYKEEAQDRIGESHFLKRDYEPGIAKLKQFIEADSKSFRSQNLKFKIAWGYFKAAKKKEALDAFQEVIDLYPASEFAYQSRYWKGIIFFKEKKYQESNDELGMIVDHYLIKDSLNDILWRIGNNHLLLDEPEKAVGVFEKLQKRFPDERYYAIHERLMKAYLKMSKHKEYLESFSKSRTIFSLKNKFVKEAFRSGNDLLTSKNFLEARQVFKEIGKELFMKKEVVNKSLFMIGESYYAEGKNDKAMKYFTELLKKGTDDDTRSRVFFRTANILTRKGDTKKAVQDYEKGYFSAKKGKIKALLLYGAGDSYLKLNLSEKAMEAFERLLIDFPEEKSLIREKMNVGLFFQKNKKNELALKAFQQVMELSPERSVRAEAQFWIGETLELQGKDEEAVAEYLKVAYAYKDEGMWGVTAKFKAGELYEKLGSYDEAIALYQDIAKRLKGQKQGDIALQKTEELKRTIKRKKE